MWEVRHGFIRDSYGHWVNLRMLDSVWIHPKYFIVMGGDREELKYCDSEEEAQIALDDLFKHVVWEDE